MVSDSRVLVFFADAAIMDRGEYNGQSNLSSVSDTIASSWLRLTSMRNFKISKFR